MPKSLTIDGESLTLATAVDFARDGGIRVELATKSKAKISASHTFVMKLAKENAAVYGINTGFGLLSEVKIPAADLSQLKYNLLRSHATGVGTPLSKEEVRLALLLRANTLAKGYSGCSVSLIKAILDLLNHGVIPWVPEQGSVGACGDLAPLAHLSLVLIGEGQAYYKGKLVDGKTALKGAGLKPHLLRAKEGLSLINGTQIMTAIGALVVH